MYDSVTRWLGDERNEANFDELFGTHVWRTARDMNNSGERKTYLLNLYVSQLNSHGFKFVRTFEMRDTGNRTEYFLAFGSNHIEGLKVMKEAMWRVDPTGRYVFSDATDRRQLILFSPEPDYDLLRRLIRERFQFASSFTIEELEEFVVVQTAFRETHYKGQILRPMEMSGELLVIQGGTRTRRGVYPGGDHNETLVLN